jgi:transcription antitermination factor NusG
MVTTSRTIPNAASLSHPPDVDLSQHWYVAYTASHCEKKAAAEILRRGVECFLPLYRSPRRWSDRRVLLDLPLFPGYVFVRLALQDRMQVLQVPHVVRFISFAGSPAVLPDKEIEVIRAAIIGKFSVEPHPFLTVGRRVRVVGGPLTGLEGILLRKKNRFRFVVSIQLIRSAFVVDVDAMDVQPL